MNKKEGQKVSQSISVSLNETDFDRIPVVQNNLFPEGIAYNPNTEQFLLSSLTQGTIYAANEGGSPAFLTNFVTAVAENLMPYWFDPTGNQPQKTTHC